MAHLVIRTRRRGMMAKVENNENTSTPQANVKAFVGQQLKQNEQDLCLVTGTTTTLNPNHCSPAFIWKKGHATPSSTPQSSPASEHTCTQENTVVCTAPCLKRPFPPSHPVLRPSPLFGATRRVGLRFGQEGRSVDVPRLGGVRTNGFFAVQKGWETMQKWVRP